MNYTPQWNQSTYSGGTIDSRADVNLLPEYETVKNLYFMQSTIDVSILHEIFQSFFDYSTVTESDSEINNDDILIDEPLPVPPPHLRFSVKAKVNKVNYVTKSKLLYDDVEEYLLDE